MKTTKTTKSTECKPIKPNSLPRFGKDGWAELQGYDITYIVGWLESLTHDEDENMGDDVNYCSARWRRYSKVCDALDLLTEVMESERIKKQSPF